MATSILPQTQQCWKEHNSPHQKQLLCLGSQSHTSGPSTGCKHSSETLLADDSVWLQRAKVCPSWLEVLRFQNVFSASKPSSLKTLLAQVSPIKPGPHLLSCQLDHAFEVLKEESQDWLLPSAFLKKAVGKKPQNREDLELIRSKKEITTGRRL